MKINKKNTKIMVHSNNGQKQPLDLNLETGKVEVKEFCYFRGKGTTDDRSKRDVKCTIALVKKAFLKLIS